MSTQTANISLKRESQRAVHLKRLGGCLLVGFVLALMVGKQEGTQTDYGQAFRQSVFEPRIFVFLGIGVLLYLLITFRPRVMPYVQRPGVRPLGAGAISVLISNVLLRWTDSGQIEGGKFNALAKAAADTGALDPFTRAFFGAVLPGTAWILYLLVLILAGAAIILGNSKLAWATAVLAAIVGVWGFFAQVAVRGYLDVPDHSTGARVSLLGYLTDRLRSGRGGPVWRTPPMPTPGVSSTRCSRGAPVSLSWSSP